MSQPRAAPPSVPGSSPALAGTVDAVREAVTAIAVARMRLDLDSGELAQLDKAVEDLHVVEDELVAELAELREAEQARGPDRQLVRALQGAAPIALFVTDRDGAVLDANPAAADLLHVGSGGLYRKPLFAFTSGRSRRRGRTLLGDAVRTGDVVEGRLDLVPREGGQVPCHVILVPDPGTREERPAQDMPAADGHLSGRLRGERSARMVQWLVRPRTPNAPIEAACAAYGAALVELCGLGVADGDVRSMLKRVTELASRGIPAVDAASVLRGDPAVPELVATSSGLAQAGDGVQHLAAGGPTFDAYRLTRVTGSSDLCADPRLGVPREPGPAAAHSCRAFPLVVDGAPAGVLTLYACASGALGTDDVVELARPFVVAAQTLVRDARAVAEIAEVRDQLQEALRYRGVIEQAKGMIMLARGCDAEEAFSVLVRMSNVRNTKLRDVAGEFVAAGGRLERPSSATERGKPERVRTDRARTDRFSPPRSSRSGLRRPPPPPA